MSKLAEKISALHKQRAEKISDLEALLTAALDGDRDLTEDESKTREALREQIAKLDKDLDQLEADEKILAARAVPVFSTAPGATHADPRSTGIVRDDRGRIIRTGIAPVDEFEGAGFVRMAIAISVA